MVDTINPNTNQPDSWDNNNQTPAEPVVPVTPDNRFYGGFDKPDETKINLADAQVPVTPTEQTQATTPQPIADVSPVEPSEVKHTSYVNTTDKINWRGVMVIGGMGLLATLIVGTGLYFGINSLNSSKLSEQQAELGSIKQEIVNLDVTPSPLELPETETPAVEAPVVVPVETPIETPIVVPAETPTPTSNG